MAGSVCSGHAPPQAVREQVHSTIPNSGRVRLSGRGAVSGYGRHPRRRRDPEPEHPEVWLWFVCNGPHGERFDWGSDVPTLTRFMGERTEADPEFPAKARRLARECLVDEETELVYTALQVLAVVGQDEDRAAVDALVNDPDPEIAAAATCCRFELEQRRRRGRL